MRNLQDRNNDCFVKHANNTTEPKKAAVAAGTCIYWRENGNRCVMAESCSLGNQEMIGDVKTCKSNGVSKVGLR